MAGELPGDSGALAEKVDTGSTFFGEIPVFFHFTHVTFASRTAAVRGRSRGRHGAWGQTHRSPRYGHVSPRLNLAGPINGKLYQIQYLY
eukprot:SAG31_NODE_10390_length_1145_cov_1.260287_1_plen_88_part_10